MKRDLDKRLREFAKRILRLADELYKIPRARRLANQISGSGPSIRLNYAESQAASSRRHFISLVETAEREARETQAALEMIIDAEFVKPQRLTGLYQESGEIVAILTTIGKNAKANQGSQKGKSRR
jgi:four helix bundle protein